MPANAVEQVLRLYPRIYFACHTRHVRDPGTGGVLSRHQAGILSHLDDVDPTTISGLADHLGVTVSTMSLSVKRLERDGYVMRTRSATDARVVELRLTEAGVRIRDAQSVLEPARVAVMLRQLKAKEQQEAVHGLRLLAAAADRAVKTRALGHDGASAA